jgi:hypothetical protein
MAILGQVHAAEARFDDAERCFGEALSTLETATPGFELGVALLRYGEVLRARVDAIARARATIARARDVFRSSGNLTWQARAEQALEHLV